MSAQTPTGSLMVNTRFPGTLAGMASPYARGASSLNHSKKLAAYVTSPLASASGFPFSHVMSAVRSSALSIIRSYHLRSSLDLSRPVLVRKAGSAASAAEMAAWASTVSHSAEVPMSLSVAGSAGCERVVREQGRDDCVCELPGEGASYLAPQTSSPTWPAPIRRR